MTAEATRDRRLKLSRKSLFLAATAVLLALLTLISGREGPAPEALPKLPGFQVDAVTRVEVSSPIEKLSMRRVSTEAGSDDFEHWVMTEPLSVPADTAQIRSLLRVFSEGVPMLAKVDEGNLKDYSLEDQDAKVVEVFTGGDVPAMSVAVGKNAGGTSSFVRISGTDVVYRADVGGRGRYDRQPSDWRDRMVLDLKADDVATLTLRRAGETLVFRRGPPEDGKPGRFGLEGAPFAVDSELLGALTRAMTQIRAGQFHNPDYDGGFEAPTAVVELSMVDGGGHRLVLGSRSSGDAALLKVDARPEVVRASGQIARLLSVPVDGFRDRAIFSLQASQISEMTLKEDGFTVVLARTGDTWAITVPPNMDADQRAATAAANALASLRAAAIVTDGNFAPSGARITLGLVDGGTRTLELGQIEKITEKVPLQRVRVAGESAVYQVQASFLDELRRAFGRG